MSEFEKLESVKPEFEETVKGVRILCNIGRGDSWYSLYLPGINSEPAIPLSEDPKVAEEVFDYAKELAGAGEALPDIYVKCEKYFKKLTEPETYLDGTVAPSL